MMNETFLSATILLLLITDPFGGIPIFVTALKNVPQTRRPWIVLREVGIAFIILTIFMFGGKQFLNLFHLSDLSLQFAGGIVLFLISLRMVFPPAPNSSINTTVIEQAHEPFIVPLAIPMLAGPSAIATVMLMTSQAPDHKIEWFLALCTTMIICAALLLLADRMQRWLGDSVLQAVERFMGLILVALSTEMILGGLRLFLESLNLHVGAA
jgi:MarC family membrane protein